MFIAELVLSIPRPGTSLLVTGIMVLIVAAYTDVTSGIIPNRLLALAFIPGAILPFIDAQTAPWHSFGAAASALVFVLLFRILGSVVFAKPGLGMGDVKLAFVLGLFFQWHVIPVFYAAACLGAAFGVTGSLLGRMHRQSRMPFAPFLLAAAIPYIVLIHEYAVFTHG